MNHSPFTQHLQTTQGILEVPMDGRELFRRVKILSAIVIRQLATVIRPTMR